MYKVMLADDEGVALDALRIMITNQFHDMEKLSISELPRIPASCLIFTRNISLIS